MLALIAVTCTGTAHAAQELPSAIWRNDEGLGDEGRLYWQTEKFCRAGTLDETGLRVAEFTTQQKGVEAEFENLRSTADYDATGANVQALLPEGTLVSLIDASTRDDYRQVKVLSRTSYEFNELQRHRHRFRHQLRPAKVGEIGFVYGESLGDLTDYTLKFYPSKYVRAARDGGLDLSGAELLPDVDAQGRTRSLNCCSGGICTNFALFNVQREGTAKFRLGLALTSALFATATAHRRETNEKEQNELPPRDEKPKPQSGPALVDVAPGPNPAAAPAPGATVSTGKKIGGIEVSGKTPEQVICLAGGKLQVRGLDSAGKVTDTVLFQVQSGAAVVPRQGFNGNVKRFTSGGQTFNMVEVRFVAQKKNGWVAAQYVKTKTACASEKAAQEAKEDKANKQADAAAALGAKLVGGIFPTFSRPTLSYFEGKRSFGASRGYRLHAAADLYRKQGEAARAILPGSIIQGPYKFYKGTYAIEVKHDNGRVVRYGEIFARRGSGITDGRIAQGAVVGYIKRVSGGCCDPMLHFEMYSGAARGTLSGSGAYQRRSDLMNPSRYLRQLEKKTFGVSY